LLLLHGTLLDHRMFFHQSTFFRDNFLLIMPDLPAHGRSRPYEDFSFLNAVEDLLAILAQEKVRHLHLFGHSMGGYIAQEFYRWAPDMVKSITWVSSAPMCGSNFQTPDQYLFKIPPVLRNLYKMGKLVQKTIDRDTITPSCAQYTKDTMLQYTKKEAINIMEVINRDLHSAEETQITCPSLVLVGESDPDGTRKENLKKWAAQTGSEYHAVPVASHLLNVDNPGSFNLIWEKWLKTIC